jgi:predicted MarR family transcription regulator
MFHLDSLAGLDSMVLHINTHSNRSPTLSDPAITLDGESYVLVPKKRRKLERAGRLPLADKTPSLNTVCFQLLGAPSALIISIYRIEWQSCA